MRCSSSAFGDVRGEQRLARGARQLDRIPRHPAATAREHEAAQAGLDLAQVPLGGARGRGLIGARDQQQTPRRRGSLAIRKHCDRDGSPARARRAPRPRARARASPRPSATAGERARRSCSRPPAARATAPAPVRATPRGPSSSRARTARRKSAAADSEARSGARTRSTSDAIIVASSRRIDALGSVSARMCSAPTTLSATRSGMLVTPSPCGAAHAPPPASVPRPPASRPTRRSPRGSPRAP